MARRPKLWWEYSDLYPRLIRQAYEEGTAEHICANMKDAASVARKFNDFYKVLLHPALIPGCPKHFYNEAEESSEEREELHKKAKQLLARTEMCGGLATVRIWKEAPQENDWSRRKRAEKQAELAELGLTLIDPTEE